MVQRPYALAEQAAFQQLSILRLVYAFEGRGHVNRFPERVHCDEQRTRTRPEQSEGTADRVRSTFRKRNGRRAVEGIVDVFNLLDRANYTEINNIFGAGAFPSTPQKDAQGRVTYGRYTEALPGRQMQLAVKLIF